MKVPDTFVVRLLDYLKGCPYDEVVGFITGFQQLENDSRALKKDVPKKEEKDD
jgi:hypothetical protein